MGRKAFIIVLVAMLMTVVSTAAFAGKAQKAKAKAELAELDKVIAFSKKTIIPLINCFANNQPHLQYMDDRYPDKFKEYTSAMEYCTSAYPDSMGSEPTLMEIKKEVLALLAKDIEIGKKLIDATDGYNNVKASSEAKKKKDSAMQKIEVYKADIEKHKQELYKHAVEFQATQKKFKEFNTEFMKKYKELQLKSVGR